MIDTEKVASFITGIGYDSIGAEAVAAVKKATLDYLGVTLAGSPEPASTIVAGYAWGINGAAESGVIGKGFKAPAGIAALANGTAAHCLDYDDSSHTWLGHPTATVLTAGLALGEKLHSSGRDIIEAYLAGFEVGSGVGRVISVNARSAGWHNTGIIGSLGATCAAAKLLKLTGREIKMALGIVASLAGGLLENFGTMTKPLHAGVAAQNGIFAAQMARQGFTASDDILESAKGFYQVFGGVAGDGGGKEMGEPWDIVSVIPGVCFKPYPCCRGTHTLVDAAMFLRDKHRLNPDDIASVDCLLSRVQSGTLAYERPQTVLECKFSVEYCVAVALLEGRVTLAHFTGEKCREERVQQFLPRVRRVLDSGAEYGDPDYHEAVVVKLKDGREYSHSIRFDLAKGQPRNPLTFEEICRKYRDCAGLVLKPADVELVLELVTRLESIGDISEIMEVVTFGPVRK